MSSVVTCNRGRRGKGLDEEWASVWAAPRRVQSSSRCTYIQYSTEGWTMEGGGVRENERVAAWVGERMGERLIISNVN